MKVVTFEHNGKRSYGLLENDQVFNVGSRLESRYPDLRSVIASNALGELKTAREGAGASLLLKDVTLLPVFIPNPEKIFCVGLNYVSHRTETKRPR